MCIINDQFWTFGKAETLADRLFSGRDLPHCVRSAWSRKIHQLLSPSFPPPFYHDLTWAPNFIDRVVKTRLELISHVVKYVSIMTLIAKVSNRERNIYMYTIFTYLSMQRHWITFCNHKYILYWSDIVCLHHYKQGATKNRETIIQGNKI